MYKNQQCNWECCVSVILSAQGGRANDGGVTDDNGDQDMETNQAQIDDVGVRIIYVSSLQYLIFSIRPVKGLGH